MRREIIPDQPTAKGPAEWFTGDDYIDVIIPQDGSTLLGPIYSGLNDLAIDAHHGDWTHRRAASWRGNSDPRVHRS